MPRETKKSRTFWARRAPSAMLYSRVPALIGVTFDCKSIAGIGPQPWRSGKHEGVHFFGKARREHRGRPTALTKHDQIHPAAEIVDRDHEFGKLVVDLEVFHVVSGRFPVGQGDMLRL